MIYRLSSICRVCRERLGVPRSRERQHDQGDQSFILCRHKMGRPKRSRAANKKKGNSVAKWYHFGAKFTIFFRENWTFTIKISEFTIFLGTFSPLFSPFFPLFSRKLRIYHKNFAIYHFFGDILPFFRKKIGNSEREAEKEKGNPGRNNFVIGWRCFIMFSDNEEMEGERVFKRWRVKTEEIVGEFDFN